MIRKIEVEPSIEKEAKRNTIQTWKDIDQQVVRAESINHVQEASIYILHESRRAHNQEKIVLERRLRHLVQNPIKGRCQSSGKTKNTAK